MSVNVSFVLQQDVEIISIDKIKNCLYKQFPDMKIDNEQQNENEIITFNINDITIAIANMPAPYPWSDLEGPCSTSYLWPKSTNELKEHKSHTLISVLGEINPLDSSILLTKITTSFLIESKLALGVYWGNATLLVPKQLFIEFTTKILPQGLPLDIWIDFRVGWFEEKISSGFTTGLEALGHMEFEVVKCPEKPSELRERFQNLARYVIENGSVIKDGDTIGNDDNERIKIVYSDSVFGIKNKVMRLEYSSIQPKKWWKFGK